MLPGSPFSFRRPQRVFLLYFITCLPRIYPIARNSAEAHSQPPLCYHIAVDTAPQPAAIHLSLPQKSPLAL